MPPTRKAALLPNGVHAAAPPGEHLVDICLVTHVPDNLVLGRVEHIVQRQRQLHDTKTGAQVPARLGHGVNQIFVTALEQGSAWCIEAQVPQRGLHKLCQQHSGRTIVPSSLNFHAPARSSLLSFFRSLMPRFFRWTGKLIVSSNGVGGPVACSTCKRSLVRIDSMQDRVGHDTLH